MKLIKLQDKFIIVSSKAEEGINPQANYFDDKVDPDNIYIGTEMFTENKIYNYIKGISSNNRTVHKIIAGIPELPSIDFSLLSEADCKTIGFIDVEKLAKNEFSVDKYQQDWAFRRMGFVRGFKAAQSLNNKMFTGKQIIEAIAFGFGICKNHNRAPFDLEQIEFIQSLQQNVWNVKVEKEDNLIIKGESDSFNYDNGEKINTKYGQPKITNNSIKVIKIL